MPRASSHPNQVFAGVDMNGNFGANPAVAVDESNSAEGWAQVLSL